MGNGLLAFVNVRHRFCTEDFSMTLFNFMDYKMRKILSYSCGFIVVCLFIFFSTNTAYALDDLSNAVMSGNKEKLEALIANGAEVKGEKGGVALYWAAMRGKYETAAVLIAHGADVNARERINGFTPLHEAVSYISDKPANTRGKMPPMDVAVAQDKKKFAELLIVHGADVNAGNKYGVTPLHKAATKEMAELLIKHGANVNAKNINNNTPLYDAIFLDKGVVEALVAHGADVNNKDRSGYTPLHAALNLGKKEIVELLIEHGAQLDKVSGGKGLRQAAAEGNVQLVKLLLANGVQIDATDEYGLPALYWAIENGRKEVIQLLIAQGANVNAKGQNGIPLTHGIRDMEIMELLLAHGADVTAKDNDGNALLGTLTDNKELIGLILARGADVNIRNMRGNTPLHIAAKKGHHDVVKVLLAHKADVNAKNDFLQTPLFDAIALQGKLADPFWRAGLQIGSQQGRAVGGIERMPPDAIGHRGVANASVNSSITKKVALGSASFEPTMEAINLLLVRGADVNAKDRRGETPLHIAPTVEIAELLLARGVPVDVTRNDGATPLHIAAVYGRKEVVQVLLDHDADVNARTKDGITPLHYAKGAEVVKLLIAKGANVDATDSGGNTPIYMADDLSVVELLLAQGATLNARNNIGQTPVLRVIRTYISNLPGHGLMSGPLGDDIVVAHGGSMEVVKALLDHGADVNLDDRDLNMPLFYVREAIKDRSYEEVVDLLKAVENSLLAHGAKLEKRKKESSPQPQQNFPPELAGIPQISLGTRVMMQVAVRYEERLKTGKENHLYYKEPGTMLAATDKPTFDDHLQLLEYFQSLPADIQKSGLWVKRMARGLWTQPDAERIDKLTQNAKLKNTSLFLCEPTSPKNGSWLVTWECNQVSPQNSVQAINCGAVESKTQPVRWECRKQGN